MGIIITLGILLVTTTSGSIAVNITGTLKDVVLTYAGFIFFQDAQASVLVIAGLIFSFVGAGYYGLNMYLKSSVTKGQDSSSSSKTKTS
jgi:hypothetical protein